MYTYSKIAKSSKIKLIGKSFEGRVILCTPSTPPPPHTHTHTHTHTQCPGPDIFLASSSACEN